MPPKQQKVQQDPMNLEELCGVVTSTSASPEAKKQAIQTLFTVAHHPRVKQELITKPDFLRSLATCIMQRTEAYYMMRWSVLAVIGELCRREHRGDVESFVERNKVARDFVAFFVQIPWFPGALRDIAAEDDEEDAQTREISTDLLAVLPNAQDTPANVSVGEEQVAPGFVWNKDQREKAKDLLYIDPSEPKQLEVLPFVIRSSNRQCGNCQKKSDKVLNRCANCKAAFYCCQQCQVEAWKSAHKHLCSAWKAKDPSAFSALFYETRAYLYDRRPESMQQLGYYNYFIQYSPTYRL